MRDAFDPEWLSLSEPLDAAARSVALAARIAAMLPARPRLLDLGAGTGSMVRWLAPRLGRAQAWLLVNPDIALLTEAFGRTATWAERRGWTVTWPGRAMLIHTPAGAWRIEGFAIDLETAPAALRFDDVDAVVCSGLLGLVSRAWLDRLVAALRSPFLASLVPNGRDAWLPRHAADRLIGLGFRRAHAIDQGFGASLGANAMRAAMRALEAGGFSVASAPSEWRVPAGALAMTRRLVWDAADAARVALPWRGQAIAELSLIHI